MSSTFMEENWSSSSVYFCLPPILSGKAFIERPFKSAWRLPPEARSQALNFTSEPPSAKLA